MDGTFFGYTNSTRILWGIFLVERHLFKINLVKILEKWLFRRRLSSCWLRWPASTRSRRRTSGSGGRTKNSKSSSATSGPPSSSHSQDRPRPFIGAETQIQAHEELLFLYNSLSEALPEFTESPRELGKFSVSSFKSSSELQLCINRSSSPRKLTRFSLESFLSAPALQLLSFLCDKRSTAQLW